MSGVSVTKLDDDSKMCKFGGFLLEDMDCVDHFYIGHLENGNAQKPIIWKKSNEFQLPQPITRCGVIQIGPFIVIFGGWTTGGKGVSDIDILDLRSKNDGFAVTFS